MTLREAMALKINMIRLRAILRPNPSERFKAMTLRDLEERTNLMETTPWEPDLVAELHEKRYREGYRDGFIAAVESYHRLLRQDGETHETEHHTQVYLRLWDHWNRLLGMWAHTDCSQRKHLNFSETAFDDGGDLPPQVR